MPTKPTSNERLKSKLSRIVKQASQAARKAEAFEKTNKAKVNSLISAARDSTKEGRYTEAVINYRKAIELSPGSVNALFAFAQYLISQNRSDAAFEILGLALEVDPANPEVLEMYVEVVHKRDLDRGYLTVAFSNLAAGLEKNTKHHRAALDFAVPHSVKDAIEVLRISPDPVTRAVIEQNEYFSRNPSETIASHLPISDKLEPAELQLVSCLVNLARGRSSNAIKALSHLEAEQIPVASLRRAIRRSRNANKPKIAQKYLKAYLKVNPTDAWAKSQLVVTKEERFSNYALGKRGFPFPKNDQEPAYEITDRKVFYLLHNSLPFNSAGYATRTHGLLKSLNEGDWTVDGVTRLGYPFDMPGNSELDSVKSFDVVDGVKYRRLVSGTEIERKNPIHSYVQRYSRSLEKLALSEQPRIIHAASNHWNGLTAVTAARRLGIPSVYEIRGLWEVTRGSRNPEWAGSNMYKFIARMEADAAKGATRVFTITNALREEMINRGVDADKIKIIPNGVDTSRFTPISKDVDLAVELGIIGKTVIGYVGSILDYEGIELLLESAAALKLHRADFHVLIVGDGAELERFKNFTVQNSLSDVVTFTGRVPHEDVERYYSLIDIAPFPRLPLPVCEMVSPLKPFEAMSMGKAVIASDVAALKEIVTPGVNGLLHAKGSALSLTESIEQLLDNRELMLRLGSQAREWVVENRDWSQLGKIISDTYEELADATPRPLK